MTFTAIYIFEVCIFLNVMFSILENHTFF